MKDASTELIAHIGGGLTTLTTCLKITRTDEVVMAFTALDQEFTFEDDLHKIGYDPTAIVSTGEMNVDNYEWQGVVDHEDITSEDIRAGVYDGAVWETYRVNWADLTQGKIILKTGTIGNVNLAYPNTFIAEGRSLSQALQVKIGMHYTPHCKWDLGDGRCKFKLVGTIETEDSLAPLAGQVIAVWQPNHAYITGDYVSPTVPNGFLYICVNPGTSGAVEPDWNGAETNAVAGLQHYLTDPGLTDNKAYIITPAETGSYVLTGPVGEVGGNARWAFLTDGIGVANQIQPITNPQDNPGQPIDTNDGRWRASNNIQSGIIVSQANDQGIQQLYDLRLNTFDNAVYGCGEVDLLLCAVSPLPDVTINEPGIIPLSQQVPISEMRTLRVRFQHTVPLARNGSRCGGGADCAIGMTSIYFKNTVNDQTLQYQMYSFDSRGGFPGGGVGPLWFNSTGPFFGVADSVEGYGEPMLTVSPIGHIYNIDIVQRVIDLLGLCPNPALDDDPSHWKITLLSSGPFVNGAAEIRMFVNQIDLVADVVTSTVPGTDIIDGGVIWRKFGIVPTGNVTLESVTPASGSKSGGTTVTLIGTGFFSGTIEGAVHGMIVGFYDGVGTSFVRPTVISPTLATVVTPLHEIGVVDVIIVEDTHLFPNAALATLTDGFTYTDTPPEATLTLSSIAPAFGLPAGGTSITLIGTAFVSGMTLTLGGSLATGVTIIDENTATAVTAAHGAGVVNAVVTIPGPHSATLSAAFEYTATPPAETLTVSSVHPSIGLPAGGISVSVVGSGFVSGATITFGGTAATGVTFVSSTLLTATTPAHVAGAVDVVVTNPSTASATLTDGFTYGTGAPPPPPGDDRSFITPGVVATVIDEHWEFTALTTDTELVTDSQVNVPFWQPKHTYWPGDSVRPSDVDNKLRAVVVSAVWDEKKNTQDVPSGKSGDHEPDWPETEGERIEDNEVEWVMVKDQWYKDGVLKFTSGLNADLAKQFEVLLYEVTGTSARFRLVLPTALGRSIQVGDEFIVEAGCTKELPVCTYKFANTLNFGGEPHVAGYNRPHDTPTDENLIS